MNPEYVNMSSDQMNCIIVSSFSIYRRPDSAHHLSALNNNPLLPQVCAAGALLNILGPELDGGMHGPRADRRALGRLLTLVMASSVIFDSVYEKRPDLE